MVRPRGSRATRLNRHWAHRTIDAVTFNSGTTSFVDLLSEWRAAFGQQLQQMTVMRMLVTFAVADTGVASGSITLGIIRGSIGLNPIARPAGATADDYTDWVARRTIFVFNRTNDTPEVANLDIRAMRKFDSSRETLYGIMEARSGGTAFALGSLDVRMLCGD